jgi:hypothetical protein
MSMPNASTTESRPATPPELDRTTDPSMGRRLAVLWALIVLPFVLSGVTVPTGLLPHAVFHPVYILFAIGAIIALGRLRSATGARVVRRLAFALIVAQAAVIAGMVGEEIAVFQHGGLAAGFSEMFQEPLHQLSASVFTLPGLLASLILIIVLTITAALGIRAEQRLAAGRQT